MANQSGSQPLSQEHGEQRISKIPLSKLLAGQSSVVNLLKGDREFINRIASLGFTIGAQVMVINNQGQGPMVVSVLGAHFALGRREAELIQVQPL